MMAAAVLVPKQSLQAVLAQRPKPYNCPFCPDDNPRSFMSFKKFRKHFQSEHCGMCPVCMVHYKALGLHFWNYAYRMGRDDHMITMISFYHSRGKSIAIRLRMQGMRNRVLANWRYYALAAAKGKEAPK